MSTPHDLARTAAALAGDESLVDDLATCGVDVRYHADDRLGVALRQARRELLRFLRALVLRLLLLLLDERRDYDVVRAEELHLLEDLGLGALADGQHGDHRGDAEQDAERSEGGAERVVANRLEGRPDTEQTCAARRGHARGHDLHGQRGDRVSLRGGRPSRPR